MKIEILVSVFIFGASMGQTFAMPSCTPGGGSTHGHPKSCDFYTVSGVDYASCVDEKSDTVCTSVAYCLPQNYTGTPQTVYYADLKCDSGACDAGKILICDQGVNP